jgi:hypothetical protein
MAMRVHSRLSTAAANCTAIFDVLANRMHSHSAELAAAPYVVAVVGLVEKWLPFASRCWPSRVMGWNFNIDAVKPAPQKA